MSTARTVQEFAGIRDLRPMLVSLWLQEEYLEEIRGSWQAENVCG
jgi:hypothetical protein